MGTNSGISWTNDTWNPWQGCFKVSQGCKACYMYREKERFGQQPNVVVRSKDATFNAPLRKLKGPLVFTCSWSDWFIEEADEWRNDAWNIIKQTPHLTYQILTKRPQNIKGRLPSGWPYPNVWLGVSVEDYNNVWRLPLLAQIPATVRFVSWEPALGYVDFKEHRHYLDWVISGGESDPINPRIADPEWFRKVRDDCLEVGIPFFHKQNGGSTKVNGVWGGNLIDGVSWEQFPLDKIAI